MAMWVFFIFERRWLILWGFFSLKRWFVLWGFCSIKKNVVCVVGFKNRKKNGLYFL